MYGIWNKARKEFQFGICEPTKRKAQEKLYQKIGYDSYKWRFEPRKIIENKKEANSMAEQTTKVVTGKVRFSYVNIFKARSFQAGQEEKFSICLLIDKKDKATLSKIKAAIEAAKKDGIANKWGGKLPANLKMPLRDGDAERAEEAEEYVGKFFLNANSNQKPGIVDENLNEVLDNTEVYSGCYGRASINFFPYNSNGSKGIAVGLNNVQKLADGEPLGGTRASAESDFGDSRPDLQDGDDDYSDMLG